MVERNETALHEEADDLLSEPLSQLRWRVRPPVVEFPAIESRKGAIEKPSYWGETKLLLSLFLEIAQVLQVGKNDHERFSEMNSEFSAYQWGSYSSWLAAHQLAEHI